MDPDSWPEPECLKMPSPRVNVPGSELLSMYLNRELLSVFYMTSYDFSHRLPVICMTLTVHTLARLGVSVRFKELGSELLLTEYLCPVVVLGDVLEPMISLKSG